MIKCLRLQLHAWGDLLKRYGTAWRHAWRERGECDAVPRLPHETQFLPAALSLQETPPSPAPRVAMWLIIAFAVIAVVWAVFGRIDVVATAHGKIVTSDRTKIIQPLQAGVVTAIHVTDGLSVRAGQTLIELDTVVAEADRARVIGDLVAARLQIARARAMLRSLDTGQAPVLERLAGVGSTQMIAAQRLLSGQYDEYRGKLARSAAEIKQREAERHSTLERIRKLEQTVPMAQQRAADYRALSEQSFVARHSYLEREQERIEQEADLATQRSTLQEISAALQAAKEQQSALTAETRRVHLDTATVSAQQAAVLEQELKKAVAHKNTLRLTAPVDGTVQQLAVHTVGGVVTPAQVLMAIVPRDHPLEVEAFVENKDIGFVKPAQEAQVKIETFQYTKYGTVPAYVRAVSHDAINDEQRGLIYSTRVDLSRTTMAVEGAHVNLTPGMAVSVEIKIGQRRVIEYFLSPLLQHGQESLRER